MSIRSISETYPRPAAPVRTCVGCRRRALAADLLRVVAQRGDSSRITVLPDPHRRMPGRGAWLHLDPRCLAKAEKRRAFGRALRVSGETDVAALASIILASGAHVSEETCGGHLS
ncbi:YlxR family protein [Hoyosella altamirensis]|uniref:YlxR family protein n=1 Tax=Hoyosella altamirensis TaxID=616997 RepID=UPI000944286F|nr:YlxR family protein [Hoyosella altamirensis]